MGNQPQHNESGVSMEDLSVYSDPEKLYCIDEIIWDNQKFKLNATMSFYVLHINDYYIINFEPLGIQVVEKSLDEALESLNEEFSMLWKIYGQEEDDKLSNDAIALKKVY